MPCEDGRDHGGVSQGLPFEELVLHTLVGIPEIGLMERGGSKHDTIQHRVTRSLLGRRMPLEHLDVTAPSMLDDLELLRRSWHI